MKIFISYVLIMLLTISNGGLNGNKQLRASIVNDSNRDFLDTAREELTGTTDKQPLVHTVKIINKTQFKTMASKTESRGKYNVANEFKYVGKYQMGRIAFRDIGYSEAWIDSVQNSIYFELNSKGRKLYYFDVSLFPPTEQEIAICKFYHNIEKKYLRKDIIKYVGKTIDGVYITKAGIIGASMLGCGYVDQFLKSGGKTNPADAYGTSVKSRLKLFQDVELKSCF